MMNLGTSKVVINNEKAVVLMKRLETGSWSVPRTPVPKLLADAGVSEDLWLETYDGALRHQQEVAPLLQTLRCNIRAFGVLFLGFIVLVATLPFIGGDLFPLFLVGSVLVWFLVCVGLVAGKKRFNDKALAKIREWKEFVEEQQPKFCEHGVRANMFTWRPLGSNIKAKLIVGGVKFTVEQEDQSNNSSRAMVEDLKALASLKDSGAVTEEEFKLAKSKIWKDYGVASSEEADAEADADVPALAIAQVLPNGAENASRELEDSLYVEIKAGDDKELLDMV